MPNWQHTKKHRKMLPLLAQTLSPVSLHSTLLRAAMIRSRSTCRSHGFHNGSTIVPQRSLNRNPRQPEGYRLQGLCQGAYSHCCFPGEATWNMKQRSIANLCSDPILWKSSHSTILNLSKHVMNPYSLYQEVCPAEAKPEANGKYSLAPYLTGHWCQECECEEFQVPQFRAFFLRANDRVLQCTKVMEQTSREESYVTSMFLTFK